MTSPSVLGEQFGLEVVDLRREFPDPATRRRAARGARPASGARSSLRRTDFGFDVVVADPSDTSIAERLREVLRQPAKLYVGGVGEIQRAIDVAYRTTAQRRRARPGLRGARGAAARRAGRRHRHRAGSTRTRRSSRSST